MAEDLVEPGRGFDVAAFAERVSALRVARECAPEDALATLDAALVELGRCVDEVRRRDRQESPVPSAATGSETAGQEHRVLDGTFERLPLPVVLVDHNGSIRRANRLAPEFLGVAPSYLRGRTFSPFVELSARAAFASQLSGVLGSGGRTTFVSRLSTGAGCVDVRLAMSRIDVPGSRQPVVVLVVLSSVPESVIDADGQGSATEEEVVVAAARRLDIMTRMTRLLLDEESLSEPVALQRAARLLTAEFADWSVIDVVRSGEMHRAAVAGPEAYEGNHGTRLLETVDPGACELPREVLEAANSVLHPLVEDDAAFGVSDGGTPVLTALRAGSVLCVPLRNQNENLGVLTLVRRSDRPRFELSDLGLIEEIADHLALALRTERRFQRRSEAVEALQASLLPQAVPAIPGLEMDVAYHAATEGVEVGGDFYDVFEVPGGWGLILGDVCGKGEEAAAVTATVRHGARLLGLWHADPVETLRQVNNAMVARYETDRFVTAVSAYLDWFEQGVRVRLASAGHPRAAVLRADGGVHFASGGGLPLGLFHDAHVEGQELQLLPGATLLLYSDGVTEARSPDGALYGDERLADVLARARGLPASALVKAVEDELFEHSAGSTHDDVALLAVRVVEVPAIPPAK